MINGICRDNKLDAALNMLNHSTDLYSVFLRSQIYIAKSK
jgi:hypothetical protein